MVTTTLVLPDTKSMAPPMPFTFLPGTIQLARSPYLETCIAPSMVSWMCPPRIMAKESSLAKKQPPGITVTVCLPALMTSASTSFFKGNGPKPRIPFSLCRDVRGLAHGHVKVTRAAPEDHVARTVGFPTLDQCEVGADGVLQQVVAALELAHLPRLAQGDQVAIW
ncbi:hypothetical protein LEMLEM_LOCUS5179 [Lemmus lemmus]